MPTPEEGVGVLVDDPNPVDLKNDFKKFCEFIASSIRELEMKNVTPGAGMEPERRMMLASAKRRGY